MLEQNIINLGQIKNTKELLNGINNTFPNPYIDGKLVEYVYNNTDYIFVWRNQKGFFHFHHMRIQDGVKKYSGIYRFNTKMEIVKSGGSDFNVNNLKKILKKQESKKQK